MSEDFQMKMKDIFVFKQEGIDSDGRVLGDFKPTGEVPQCFDEFKTRGLLVDKKMFESNK